MTILLTSFPCLWAAWKTPRVPLTAGSISSEGDLASMWNGEA